MIATFVIGLREGLEAALIIGIVAAFLRQQGRRDALRPMWAGVAIAVVLCTVGGVVFYRSEQGLPQQKQEALETVIGLVAVAMVTYMVVWMKRHSRDLRGSLHGAATSALADGSAKALVLMAFLAVVREGVETAFFLVANFNAKTGSPAAKGGGVLLGLGAAVVIGYLIYSGGVRINLSKFFRVTGVVLVVVAAGLLATAAHTAYEAGWLLAGQSQVVDLSWLVRPGTVLFSLFTGMLGIQPQPVVAEVVAYLAYLVPAALYVAWPRRPARPRAVEHVGPVRVAA